MTFHIHTKRSPLLALGLVAMLLLMARSGKAQAGQGSRPLIPRFSTAKAFDVSLPVRDLAWRVPSETTLLKFPPMRRPVGADRGLGDDGASQSGAPQSTVPGRGFAGDGALQTGHARQATALIPAPSLTFEGLANSDNLSLFGFQVSPPDPNGEVGPNHYVEMVTSLSLCTLRMALGCLVRLRLGRYGAASQWTTALTYRATRSCCTISSMIAGSSPS